jgi:hypothetical protein
MQISSIILTNRNAKHQAIKKPAEAGLVAITTVKPSYLFEDFTRSRHACSSGSV